MKLFVRKDVAARVWNYGSPQDEYNFIVTDGNGDHYNYKFDSNAASQGWNLVVSIDLPEGETTVTISNKTDGRFVVADAIRWSPSAGD